jgi:CDGSH iron-sulfur domain-containing protein 3
MAAAKVAQPFPYYVEVVAGKTYEWCACGRSATQPFCDKSHAGTGMEPVNYTATASKRIAFCGCKASKRGAICDSSHNML